MASVTLNRPDLYPAGTTVGVYPAGAKQSGQAPGAAVIATGVTDSAGALSVTNAGILSGTQYVCWASVGGENRYAFVRSTLDTFDTGRATGTGNTTSGSAALASVTATTGAFAIGQRIVGPGIPPGTFLIAGSGASWTMSDKATATASGVALEGHGARVPAAVLGATAVPSRQATGWRAQLLQRRSITGTS
jgi:hypothetical protein